MLVLLLLLEVDELGSRNFHASISVQWLSSLFLNAFVGGASTTCCGNAFRLLITRMLKKDVRTAIQQLYTPKNFYTPIKKTNFWLRP